MSRSAFVVMRWSNLKSPCRCPLPACSAGSDARRSSSARIFLQPVLSVRAETHARDRTASVSKRQSSVFVARLAGPLERGRWR